MGDECEKTRGRPCGPSVDGADAAVGDGAREQHGVGDIFHRELRRVTRGAGDLRATIRAVDGLADAMGRERGGRS